MQDQFRLTVAQAKRLIARGIRHHPDVRHALESGKIVITTGSTNAYIYEELSGERIDKSQFMTGNIVPSKGIIGTKRPATKIPNLVIVKGEPKKDLDWLTALAGLEPGDVVFKGGNALNYERKQVGILIGHPEGGTIGKVYPITVARRAKLIHPIGLEKSVPTDLAEAAARVNRPADGFKAGNPALWLSPGEPFTEIEALKYLCGVDAWPIASGGIGGAEGGTWLLVEGTPEEIANAASTVSEIAGEPPTLD
ncbi:MAG: hypothetical protein JXQ73_12445 [Phycisphaerae bacterium]|nr:hypothetical protein [Phycisphaerae bacterium]